MLPFFHFPGRFGVSVLEVFHRSLDISKEGLVTTRHFHLRLKATTAFFGQKDSQGLIDTRAQRAISTLPNLPRHLSQDVFFE